MCPVSSLVSLTHSSLLVSLPALFLSLVDENRVILEDLTVTGEDYVNASFITGYYNRVEFIATQHPLQSTQDTFWSMVVERNIKTIVMLGPLQNPKVGMVSCVGSCVCDTS